MNAGGPSALANGAKGGLWRRGHDDGVGDGAPVSICTALALTELEQRALGEAMGCWGDGGGIAVMEEWPDKPVPGNDGGGERCCCCGRCERRRRADSAKWGRG